MNFWVQAITNIRASSSMARDTTSTSLTSRTMHTTETWNGFRVMRNATWRRLWKPRKRHCRRACDLGTRRPRPRGSLERHRLGKGMRKSFFFCWTRYRPGFQALSSTQNLSSILKKKIETKNLHISFDVRKVLRHTTAPWSFWCKQNWTKKTMITTALIWLFLVFFLKEMFNGTLIALRGSNGFIGKGKKW